MATRRSASASGRLAKKAKVAAQSSVLLQHLQRIARTPMVDIDPKADEESSQFANVTNVIQVAYRNHFQRTAGTKPGQAVAASGSPSPFIFSELRRVLVDSDIALDRIARLVDLLIAAVHQEGIGGQANTIGEVIQFHADNTTNGEFPFGGSLLTPTQAHPTLLRLFVALAFDAKAAVLPLFPRIIALGFTPLLTSAHTNSKPANTEEMHALLEAVFANLEHFLDGVLAHLLPQAHREELCVITYLCNWEHVVQAFAPLLRSHVTTTRRMAASVLAGVLRKAPPGLQPMFLKSLLEEMCIQKCTEEKSAQETADDALTHVLLFCMQDALRLKHVAQNTAIIVSSVQVMRTLACEQNKAKSAHLQQNAALEGLTASLANVHKRHTALFGGDGSASFTKALCAALQEVGDGSNALCWIVAALRLCRLLLEQSCWGATEVHIYVECVASLVKGNQSVFLEAVASQPIGELRLEMAKLIGGYPLLRHADVSSEAYVFLLETILPQLLAQSIHNVSSAAAFSAAYDFIEEIIQQWVECARIRENVQMFAHSLLPHVLHMLTVIPEKLAQSEELRRKTSLRKVARTQTIRILAALSAAPSSLSDTDCIVRARESLLPSGKWLSECAAFMTNGIETLKCVRMLPSGPRIVLPEALSSLIYSSKPVDDGAEIYQVLAAVESAPCCEKLFYKRMMNAKHIVEQMFFYKDWFLDETTESEMILAVAALYSYIRYLVDLPDPSSPVRNTMYDFVPQFADSLEKFARKANSTGFDEEDNITHVAAAFSPIRPEIMLLLHKYVIPWLNAHDDIHFEARASFHAVSETLLRHMHPNIRHIALRCALGLAPSTDAERTAFLATALQIEQTNAIYIDELHEKKEAIKNLLAKIQQISAESGGLVDIATSYCIGLSYSTFRESAPQLTTALAGLVKRHPVRALKIISGHLTQCVIAAQTNDTSVLPLPWRNALTEPDGSLVCADPALVARSLFAVFTKGLLPNLTCTRIADHACDIGSPFFESLPNIFFPVSALYPFVRIFLSLLGFEKEKIRFQETAANRQTKERLNSLIECIGASLGGVLKAHRFCTDAIGVYWGMVSYRRPSYVREYKNDDEDSFEYHVQKPFRKCAEALLSWNDTKIQKTTMEALASLEVFPFNSKVHLEFLRSLVERDRFVAKDSGRKKAFVALKDELAVSRKLNTKISDEYANNRFAEYYFKIFGAKALEKAARSTDASMFAFWLDAPGKFLKDTAIAVFVDCLDAFDECEKYNIIDNYILKYIKDRITFGDNHLPLRMAWALIATARHGLSCCDGAFFAFVLKCLLERAGLREGHTYIQSAQYRGPVEVVKQTVSVLLEFIGLFPKNLITGREMDGYYFPATTEAFERCFSMDGISSDFARKALRFLLRAAVESTEAVSAAISRYNEENKTKLPESAHPIHEVLLKSPALLQKALFKSYATAGTISTQEIHAQIALFREVASCTSDFSLTEVQNQSQSQSIAQRLLQPHFAEVFRTFDIFLRRAIDADALLHEVLDVFALVTFQALGVQPGTDRADVASIEKHTTGINTDDILTFLLTFCKERALPEKASRAASAQREAVVKALERMHTALRVSHVFALLSKQSEALLSSYAQLFGKFSRFTLFEGSNDVGYAVDGLKTQILATMSALFKNTAKRENAASFDYFSVIRGLLARFSPEHKQQPKARDILAMNTAWESLRKHFTAFSAESADASGLPLRMTLQTIFAVVHSGHSDACTFAAAVVAAMLWSKVASNPWKRFTKVLLTEEILPAIRQLLRQTNGTIRTSALAMLGAFAESAHISGFPSHQLLHSLTSTQTLSDNTKEARKSVLDKESTTNAFEMLGAPQVAEMTSGLKRIQAVLESSSSAAAQTRITLSDYIVPFLNANIVSIIQRSTQGYFLTDHMQKRRSGANGIFDKTTQLQFVTALVQTITAFVPLVTPRHALSIGKMLLASAAQAHAHHNMKVCELLCNGIRAAIESLPKPMWAKESTATVIALHFLQKQLIPKLKDFLTDGKPKGKQAASRETKPDAFNIRGSCMKLLLVALRTLTIVPQRAIQAITAISSEDNATLRTMRSRISAEGLSPASIRAEVLQLMAHVVTKLRSKTNGKTRERARRALKSFVLEFRDMQIFGEVLKAMCGTLRDGYQLHVLSYSIVDLLAECQAVLTDSADASSAFVAFAPDILDILFTHYFGLIGEEKKRIKSRAIAKKRTMQDDHTEMRRNRCLEGVTLLFALAQDTAGWALRAEHKIRFLFGAADGEGSHFLKGEKRPKPNQALIVSSQKFLEAAAQGIVQRFERISESLDGSVPTILQRAGAIFAHNLEVTDAIGAAFESKFSMRGILQNISHLRSAKLALVENSLRPVGAAHADIGGAEDGLIIDGSYAKQYAKTFSIQGDVQRRDVDFASTPVLHQNTAAIAKSILRRAPGEAPDESASDALVESKSLSFDNVLTMELVTEFHVLLAWKLFPFVEKSASRGKPPDARTQLFDPLLGAVTGLIKRNTRDSIVVQCLKFYVAVLSFAKADTQRSAGELYPAFPALMQPILDSVFAVIQRGPAIRRDCYKALTAFVRFAASSFAVSSARPFAIPRASVAVLLTSVHSNLIDTRESLLHSGLALVKELLLGVLKQIRYHEAQSPGFDGQSLMPPEMLDIVPPVLQCMLHTSDGGVQNRCLSILATFVSDYVLQHATSDGKRRAAQTSKTIDLQRADDLLQHIFDTLLSHIVRYTNEEAKANILRLLNVLLRRLPLDVLQRNTKILLPVLASDLVRSTSTRAQKRTDSRALFPEKARVAVSRGAAEGDAARESAEALQSLCADRDCWTLCVKDVLLAWLSQPVASGIDVLTTACAVSTEVFSAFPEQLGQADADCETTKPAARAAMLKCASRVVHILEDIAALKKNPCYKEMSNHSLVFHVLNALNAMGAVDELENAHFADKEDRKNIRWHILAQLTALTDTTRPVIGGLLATLYAKLIAESSSEETVDEKAYRTVLIGVLALLRQDAFDAECATASVEALRSLVEFGIQRKFESGESLRTHVVESLRKAAVVAIRPVKAMDGVLDAKARESLERLLSALAAVGPIVLPAQSGPESYPWGAGLAMAKWVTLCRWVYQRAKWGSPALQKLAKESLKMLHGMALPVVASDTASAQFTAEDGTKYALQAESFALLAIFAKGQRALRATRGAKRHMPRSRRVHRKKR